MHKILLVLGILLHRQLHGYELHRIVRAHGELYADLKKANLYYLLDRLAKDGYLRMETEHGTRGARGERLIYEITDQGRHRFHELLREILLTFEPIHTGIGTAVVFLAHLPPADGLQLLVERRHLIAERRATMLADLGGQVSSGPLVHIARDYLLSLIDAEIIWIDRSLAYLRERGWAASSCSGSSLHIAKEISSNNEH